MGAVVVAAPTAFDFFSDELGGWPFGVRLAVYFLWLGLAVALVVFGLRHEAKVDSATESLEAHRVQARKVAEGSIFRALLQQAAHLPEGWQATVYVFNSVAGRLEPVYPTHLPPEAWELRCFAPGHGATGLAWERGSSVVKLGSEVHDGTHFLTVEQQQEFSEFNSVAAIPIYRDGVEMIGVLAVISRAEDTYFDTAPGQALLEQTAVTLGVVIPLLRR